MTKIIKYSILIMTTLLFIGCTSGRGPELPANHLIDGTYIDIHSPNSKGWFKMVHSNSQVVFARKGNTSGESHIARVDFFPLPVTKTKKEFFDFIKTQTSKSSNKERFITIEYSFEPSEKRSYLCAEAKQLSKDKMAKTSPFSTEEQFMQVKSLFCKDPKREGAGLMIGYSFRGYAVSKSFDKEADSFIDGVQFPNIH